MGADGAVVADDLDVRVDVYASQWHYLDHLEPIWRGLPDEVRGDVLVTAPALRRHPVAVDAVGRIPGSARISRVLVAGAVDMETASRQRWGCALVEHGAGQGYVDAADHPSYPGGKNRGAVGLFLCTNRSVARRNDSAYPSRSEVVGSPRLDVLSRIRADRHSTEPPGRPTLALTWHFPCRASREAFWAFPEYQAALVDLVSLWPGRVIGTSHPKAWRHVEIAYRQAGIEFVRRWEDVVARADVVSFDNSSVGFEACALGIPVVVVDSQRWRQDVRHGLRFWDRANVGPRLRSFGPPRQQAVDWVEAGQRALAGGATNVEDIYPHRGEAVERAVDAVCRWVGFRREVDVAG